MHDISKQTQGELASLYDETKSMIAEVQAMSHLSFDEKQARIAEIKRNAAAKTQSLMSRARDTIALQTKKMSELDQQSQETGMLLARAQMLAGGDFKTMPDA